MSFQRPSSLRNAFENAKVKFPPAHARQGFDKMTDAVVSAIVRKVGMVREASHYNLSPRTVGKLRAEGIL